MDIRKLKEVLVGEPRYRFEQCARFVFADFESDWGDADSLPKSLRDRLNREVPLDLGEKIFESKKDGSAKALLKFPDGAVVETVLMRHKGGRNTVCVSCQAGCAMGCAFCATGKLGFKRNLEDFEIYSQVLIFERYLKKFSEKVDNVVFMGMGEPMMNFENVMSAVKVLNDAAYFGIGARKISISTCGIVPGILELNKNPLQINLAVSLHAPNDEIRARIMPINARFGLAELLDAISKYIAKTGRKVMIEYVLLRGVNDSEDCAKELSVVLRKKLGRLFMVNLIAYNEMGGFKAPMREDLRNFRRVLEENGIEVCERFRIGHDLAGACGQLAGK